MSPEVEYVEVQLELGHEADPNPRNAPEGFTHQWTLFVRGPDHCKIEEFVERVTFNLHESFPKNRRSFREPPFSVREFGYAGFELPIDIYFKNKEEPKKITYMYDLYLDNNVMVRNTRREKLTFQNPSPDFKKKLLRAGGRCYSDSKEKTHQVAVKQKAKPVDTPPLTPASNPTASPRINKQSGQKTSAANPKQRIPQKDIPTHNSVAITTAPKPVRDKPPVAKVQPEKGDTFTDLFGPPLATRPSPDPVKQKERSRVNVKTENETKVKQEPKETGNSGRAHSADTSSTKSGQKSCPSHGTKRERSSSRSRRSSSKKKRKRDRRRSSSSSSSAHDSDTTPVHNDSSRKCDSKLKSKAESGEDRQRTKVKGKDIRSVASAATGASNSSQKSKDVKKENFTSTTISFSNNNNTGTTTLEIKSVKKEKTWDSESKKSKSREFSNEESETVTGAANNSDKNNGEKSHANHPAQERPSSSSPASVASDTIGPQTANGSRDDVLSPPSPASESRRKKGNSASDSDSGTRGKKCDGGRDVDEESRSADRQKYLTELLWIQKRINETNDPILLQQIVDMIENNTSEYEVTETSFDFNILNLDDATLSKLRQIVEKG